MLTTEEEAKTKRCQESFAAAAAITPDGHTYASSWHYPPPPMGAASAVQTAPAMCIGSACMAWRWYDDGDEISDVLGYCGKAGKP